MASVKKFFKRLGRKTAKVHKQINRVATPIAAAGATFIAGPVGGAAVTALGAEAGRYFRATEARNQGIQGRAARSLGRGERKRVAIYGGIGTGVGVAGAFTTALATGSSFGQALGSAAFGHGGKALLFGADGTVFASSSPTGSGFVTAGNLAAQKSTGVPGLVTQSEITGALAGGAPEAAAAASGGSSLLDKSILTALGLAQSYRAPAPVSAGARGTIDPNEYTGAELSSLFGGGGGGGESGGGGGGLNSPLPGMGAEESSKGGLAAAILLGALLLAG